MAKTLLYGKNAKVEIGTAEMKCRNWTMRTNAEMFDDTDLGEDWRKPVPVLDEWSATLEATYNPAETSGQKVLENAKMSGTKITNLELWVNGTNYWAPDTSADTDAGAYVSGFEIPMARAGVGLVTFTITGYGPIKYN